MKKLFCLMVMAFFLVGCSMALVKDSVRVVIETSKGDIEIDIYTSKAPLSSNSFLAYVDQGRFVQEKSGFFRAARDLNYGREDLPRMSFIEGGIMDPERLSPPFVEHEPTSQTDLSHQNGAVSLSRGATKASAGRFFICIGDQTALNDGGTWSQQVNDGRGYAVFGQVVSGMDVVLDIQSGDVELDALKTSVSIIKVYRK